MTRSEEKMTNPLLDSQMINDLCDPFHPSLVEWKPQAVSKDGKRALAVPYIDARHYQQRLDQVSPGWHSAYEFIKPDGSLVRCRLTIAGVTREEVGESDASDNNTATSAVAQSFKRACTAFGVGRYLYFLPQSWCEYDSQSRRIVKPPVLPAWAKPGGGGYPLLSGRGDEPAATEQRKASGANGREIREKAGESMSVEEARALTFTLKSKRHAHMTGKSLGEVADETPDLLDWLVTTYSPTPKTQHLKDAAILISNHMKEENEGIS
jgi:hypothetical protein